MSYGFNRFLVGSELTCHRAEEATHSYCMLTEWGRSTSHIEFIDMQESAGKEASKNGGS